MNHAHHYDREDVLYLIWQQARKTFGDECVRILDESLVNQTFPVYVEYKNVEMSFITCALPFPHRKIFPIGCQMLSYADDPMFSTQCVIDLHNKSIRRVGTRQELKGDIPLEIERSMADSRKYNILDEVFQPLKWNQTIPPPGILRYFSRIKFRIDSQHVGPCHIPIFKNFHISEKYLLKGLKNKGCDENIRHKIINMIQF